MLFGDMDVTKDMLVRYLSCETTLAEETAIVKWLDKDPSNRKELNDLDFAYSASLMVSVPKSACRSRCFSSVWRVAAAQNVTVKGDAISLSQPDDNVYVFRRKFKPSLKILMARSGESITVAVNKLHNNIEILDLKGE